MDLDRIINEIVHYAQTNAVGSVAAGIILLFLLIRKPKLFVVVLVLGAAALGVMLIFDKLSSSGISDKDFRSLHELK